MSKTILENLSLTNDYGNLLIMGIPSTIEKQFSNISFSKNVTPLLKVKKIDFALIFALNTKHLNKILQEVMPFLKSDAKLWIAYPQRTSKITSDIGRAGSSFGLHQYNYKMGESVGLDYVWRASNFYKSEDEEHLINERQKCLFIEFEFLDEISDENVRQIIVNTSLLADEEHRSLGGGGLTINNVKIERLIPVLQELPV